MGVRRRPLRAVTKIQTRKVQIPAVDVQPSATFYRDSFGWRTRGDGANHLSFTDTTGDMIGACVSGRSISREPGVLPSIYVHGIDAALERVTASGGLIVKPPYHEGELRVSARNRILGAASMPGSARVVTRDGDYR
jgi:predicted enzyme related to lactoylglutathione lyase